MRLTVRVGMVFAAGFLAAVAAAPAAGAASDWTRVSVAGSTDPISAIEYQGPDRLWLTTSTGKIYRRVGGSFVNEATFPGVAFSDIEFQAGGQVGLAAGANGANGVVYRSANGGDSWAPVVLPNVNNTFSCGSVAATPPGSVQHVRFGAANVAFLLAGSRQILKTADAASAADVGTTWVDWNHFDPSPDADPANDDCRYSGQALDALFLTGAPVRGYFTGTDRTRFLSNLANATATASGFNAARPSNACYSIPCVLTGDPAGNAKMQSVDGGTMYGTEDNWVTYFLPQVPNRGSTFPSAADIDWAAGVNVAAGPDGQLFNSTDGLKTAYRLEVPADVAATDFSAVSNYDATHAAAGGAGGVLLLTERANARPAAGAPPPPDARDRKAPVISLLRATKRKIVTGKGTTFTFTLSEAATVKLAFSRAERGRKVGGRCRKATRKNRSKRRCKRYVATGTLSRSLGAGARSIKFTGRLKGKKLKPGRYRVIATAVDAAKNKSAARSVSLTVVKKPRRR